MLGLFPSKWSESLTDETAWAQAASSKSRESSWLGPCPWQWGEWEMQQRQLDRGSAGGSCTAGVGRNVPVEEPVFNGLWKMCLQREPCYKESLQGLLLSSGSNLFCRYKTMTTKSCLTSLELKFQLQTCQLIALRGICGWKGGLDLFHCTCYFIMLVKSELLGTSCVKIIALMWEINRSLINYLLIVYREPVVIYKTILKMGPGSKG